MDENRTLINLNHSEPLLLFISLIFSSTLSCTREISLSSYSPFLVRASSCFNLQQYSWLNLFLTDSRFFLNFSLFASKILILILTFSSFYGCISWLSCPYTIFCSIKQSSQQIFYFRLAVFAIIDSIFFCLCQFSTLLARASISNSSKSSSQGLIYLISFSPNFFISCLSILLFFSKFITFYLSNLIQEFISFYFKFIETTILFSRVFFQFSST